MSDGRALAGPVLLGIAALAAIAWYRGSVGGVDPSAATIHWGSGAAKAQRLADDMVLIPAGRYRIGDDSSLAGADAPIREVELGAFRIDRHEVTNEQFAEFVRATAHVTAAEREGGGWIYRGGQEDWAFVKGANWRHPLGPDSSIESAPDHPVVLVTWEDARAYAKWAGKRLPTEAEWEVAARAATSAGGPAEDWQASANFWQGSWPRKNELRDGYFYTAPVGSFAANKMGLVDMIGNVWEWTSDWYSETPPTNAKDPVGPPSGTTRVSRGGSWFCSPNYCGAYRPGFRGKSPPDRAFNNVGFRCAADAS